MRQTSVGGGSVDDGVQAGRWVVANPQRKEVGKRGDALGIVDGYAGVVQHFKLLHFCRVPPLSK